MFILVTMDYGRSDILMQPKERERMFFGISDMSAWKFVGTNILNILYLLQDKKDLHGRGLQQLLWGIFDEIWTSGNDLTYTILNTYEEEGYVKSYWEDNPDPNRRYIRYYKITDQGIEYLRSLKSSFHDTLNLMQKIFEHSLEFIWGDDITQPPPSNSKPISSSTFTTINVLNYMFRRKYKLVAETTISMLNNPTNAIAINAWVYGKEIKDMLEDNYNGVWKPSDGVLYPLLSKLDTAEYLKSRWSNNEEEGFKKKRTVREYVITEKGEDYLKELISPEAGLKNKILQLRTLCSKSINIIYGNSTANISNVQRLITKYCE